MTPRIVRDKSKSLIIYKGKTDIYHLGRKICKKTLTKPISKTFFNPEKRFTL
jgi:hypothetical protein